jgi:hypothetical protein
MALCSIYIPKYHWPKSVISKNWVYFWIGLFSQLKKCNFEFFFRPTVVTWIATNLRIFFSIVVFFFFRAVSNNKQPFSIIWQNCSNLSPFTNMAQKAATYVKIMSIWSYEEKKVILGQMVFSLRTVKSIIFGFLQNVIIHRKS